MEKGSGHEVWRYGDDMYSWLASLRARGSGIEDAPWFLFLRFSIDVRPPW